MDTFYTPALKFNFLESGEITPPTDSEGMYYNDMLCVWEIPANTEANEEWAHEYVIKTFAQSNLALVPVISICIRLVSFISSMFCLVVLHWPTL